MWQCKTLVVVVDAGRGCHGRPYGRSRDGGLMTEVVLVVTMVAKLQSDDGGNTSGGTGGDRDKDVGGVDGRNVSGGYTGGVVCGSNGAGCPG